MARALTIECCEGTRCQRVVCDRKVQKVPNEAAALFFLGLAMAGIIAVRIWIALS